MKRVTHGLIQVRNRPSRLAPLGAGKLLVGLLPLALALASGCAAPTTSEEGTELGDEDGIVASDGISAGEAARAIARHPTLARQAAPGCASCGPIPVPWREDSSNPVQPSRPQSDTPPDPPSETPGDND